MSLDLIDSSDDEKLLVGNDDDVFHQTLDLVSTLTAEGVSINYFTNSTSCSDKLQYVYVYKEYYGQEVFMGMGAAMLTVTPMARRCTLVGSFSKDTKNASNLIKEDAI